jgi:DNA-binding response OmpR family regulator
VLLVEDEPLIRLGVADYLRECGFRVLEASNAEDAIAILTASSPELRVDMVFSDVRMPGRLDGFGLARWVRQHRPGLPVLLGSGDAKKAEVARELCEEEGLFEKPYDLGKLVARLRAILDRPD